MNHKPLKFYWDLIRLVKAETAASKEHAMKFMSDTDESVIVHLDGDTYIAFDGTDTGREWVENAITTKDDKYDMAYGFKNAAVELANNMLQFLDGSKTNYVSGYSRGGAIAQDFAMLARNAGYKCEVVTFGSPRAGGKEFCRLMKGIEHTRVVIKGDPVPMVPLPIRFKHYETKLVLLDKPEGMWRPSQIHRSYGTVLSSMK